MEIWGYTVSVQWMFDENLCNIGVLLGPWSPFADLSGATQAPVHIKSGIKRKIRNPLAENPREKQ